MQFKCMSEVAAKYRRGMVSAGHARLHAEELFRSAHVGRKAPCIVEVFKVGSCVCSVSLLSWRREEKSNT